MSANIELSILLYIQENFRGVMDGFWIAVTSLADKGWFWIALGLGLTIFKKTRMTGVMVLVSLAVNGCLTNLILKDLIGRPRPYTVCPELTTLIPKLTSFSFPSGHTSVSFSGAFVLCKKFPKKMGIPAVILATMIGFSRMYVGVHYPTDVLGGILVGVLASTAAYYLVTLVNTKLGERKTNG